MMSSPAVLDRVDNPRFDKPDFAPTAAHTTAPTASHEPAGPLPRRIPQCAARRLPDEPDQLCRLVLLIGGLRDEINTRKQLNLAGIRVTAAATPDQARAACIHVRFDAVMVNAAALQPTLAHGVERLRSWFAGPLLVVDSTGNEGDDIDALVQGASACVRWGASARLLYAHLLSQFKQAQASHLAADQDALALPGGWRFDSAASALRRANQEMPLTRQQLGLLQCLAQPFGRVVARAELEAKVSPAARALKRHTIEVYIGRLRQRLIDASFDAFCIEAVRGRGYRLRAAAD